MQAEAYGAPDLHRFAAEQEMEGISSSAVANYVAWRRPQIMVEAGWGSPPEVFIDKVRFVSAVQRRSGRRGRARRLMLPRFCGQLEATPKLIPALNNRRPSPADPSDLFCPRRRDDFVGVAGDGVTFVNVETTLADVVPQLAQFRKMAA
ncbi:hypothetical protein ACFYTC_19325 [Actinomadura nitritigenes]|uniref:hypothetical protein n=1 Tax=Actinomadura nitritigenes TaxID=134602 RepID=UPI0036D1BD74